MRKLITVLSVFCLAHSSGSYGQEDGSRLADREWFHYTTADGLLSNSVTALARDPGGFIWVATEKDPETLRGGVTVFNPESPFLAVTNLGANPGGRVREIAFEPVGEENRLNPRFGGIWFATSRGVYRLDRQGRWRRYTMGNSRLPTNAILSVAIDQDLNKWFSTHRNGLIRLNREGNWKLFLRGRNFPSNLPGPIHLDRQGRLWVGSLDRGVINSVREDKWSTFTQNNSGLLSNSVNDIAEDSRGRVWFATAKGISVLDGNNWMSYSAINSPLAQTKVTSIVIDPSDNKWIGTSDAGLYRLTPSGQWTHYTQENSSLPADQIKDMIVDPTGDIWIGTPHGLIRLSCGRRCPGDWQAPPTALPPIKYADYSLLENVAWKETQPQDGPSVEQFGQGITWRALEEPNRVILAISLPRPYEGDAVWSYVALAFSGSEDSGSLDYDLTEADDDSPASVFVSGAFTQVTLRSNGLVKTVETGAALDLARAYPYPSAYLPELERLLPKEPPSAPVALKAQSLIKKDSEGDMLKVARDLVYSRLFCLMPYDYGDENQDEVAASSIEDLFRKPEDVLTENRGVAASKSQLLCSLATSLGIPSRTVLNLKGYAWSELWITGLGWIPAETTFPVYDYPWPQRVSFPKRFSPPEHLISSKTSDRTVPLGIRWFPAVRAQLSTGQYNLLKDPNQFMQTKLIIAKPSWTSSLPNEVALEILPNNFLFIHTRAGRETLVIRDGRGRDTKKVEFKSYDMPLNLDLRPDLTWIVVPRKKGSYVVLETLEWREGVGSPERGTEGEDSPQEGPHGQKALPPLGESPNQ